VRAELVAAGSEPDRTVLAELPVPIAHRLLAIEDLGTPLLASFGVTADRATALEGFGTEDGIDGRVELASTPAPAPALLDGDLADGEAAARGSDFWFGVLASYLPVQTATDAANAIGADLYTPATRGAQQCVYGTLTPTSPDLLPLLQIVTVAWAEAAPSQAGAQATTLADGVTVQLSVCDPGAAADVAPTAGVAEALVARQIARL
jgi:hypothetical protein